MSKVSDFEVENALEELALVGEDKKREEAKQFYQYLRNCLKGGGSMIQRMQDRWIEDTFDLLRQNFTIKTVSNELTKYEGWFQDAIFKLINNYREVRLQRTES